MSRPKLQPYPGLRAFERYESRIFFGRQQQVDDLLTRLKQHHFLAVLGASGSGKSSLVKAGLLPGLEKGYMGEVGSRWAIAEMRPGDQPFVRLAEGLLADKVFGEVLGRAVPAALAAELRRGSRSLHEILTHAPLPAGTRLLLMVDQFEEMFRFREQEENQAAAFVALLLEACTHPDVYVVITMRSDFLGAAAEFHGLPEAINDGFYLVPRLTREQLRTAISLPAQLFGGQVEDALANHLLNEAGNDPDQLPLLQHVLMWLWDNDADKILTLDEYLGLNGLHGALNDHVEQAWQELDTDGQNVAETLFRALTERSKNGRIICRPLKIQTFLDATGVSLSVLTGVVNTFYQSGRHFLTLSQEPLATGMSLDISHESLIRQWQKLSLWAMADGIQGNDQYNKSQITPLNKAYEKSSYSQFSNEMLKYPIFANMACSNRLTGEILNLEVTKDEFRRWHFFFLPIFNELPHESQLLAMKQQLAVLKHQYRIVNFPRLVVFVASVLCIIFLVMRGHFILPVIPILLLSWYWYSSERHLRQSRNALVNHLDEMHNLHIQREQFESQLNNLPPPATIEHFRQCYRTAIETLLRNTLLQVFFPHEVSELTQLLTKCEWQGFFVESWGYLQLPLHSTGSEPICSLLLDKAVEGLSAMKGYKSDSIFRVQYLHLYFLTERGLLMGYGYYDRVTDRFLHEQHMLCPYEHISQVSFAKQKLPELSTLKNVLPDNFYRHYFCTPRNVLSVHMMQGEKYSCTVLPPSLRSSWSDLYGLRTDIEHFSNCLSEKLHVTTAIQIKSATR